MAIIHDQKAKAQSHNRESYSFERHRIQTTAISSLDGSMKAHHTGINKLNKNERRS